MDRVIKSGAQENLAILVCVRAEEEPSGGPEFVLRIFCDK